MKPLTVYLRWQPTPVRCQGAREAWWGQLAPERARARNTARSPVLGFGGGGLGRERRSAGGDAGRVRWASLTSSAAGRGLTAGEDRWRLRRRPGRGKCPKRAARALGTGAPSVDVRLDVAPTCRVSSSRTASYSSPVSVCSTVPSSRSLWTSSARTAIRCASRVHLVHPQLLLPTPGRPTQPDHAARTAPRARAIRRSSERAANTEGAVSQRGATAPYWQEQQAVSQGRVAASAWYVALQAACVCNGVTGCRR